MTLRLCRVAAAAIFLLPFGAAVAEPDMVSRPVLSETDWSGPHLGFGLAWPRGQNSWRQASDGLELLPGPWQDETFVIRFGRDWQRGPITYGAGISYGLGSSIARPQDALFINCSGCATEVGDLVTLTGRIGLAAGRAHVFMTGGWARGSVIATYFNGILTYADANQEGWTLGLGAEQRIRDGLSLSISYDHIDLGTLAIPAYLPTGETRIAIDRMQVGMTVRW
ncbi:MAG: outer membrane protein [Tabrizicola sp.]